MDRAYTNAVKRRRELQAELEEIDGFLELWKRYAGTEPEQTLDQQSGAPQETGPTNGTTPKAPRTDLRIEEMAPIIREALLKHGRPMTRGKLVPALASKGVLIGGVKPARNMGTIMWRLRDLFTNIEGQGYWPKGEPCQVVGYVPPSGEGDKEVRAAPR